MSAILQINSEGTQEYIQKLAQDVVSEISRLDPSHSKELLGILVSEVFRAATEQERREERRQRQADHHAVRHGVGDLLSDGRDVDSLFGHETLPFGFRPKCSD